MSFEEVKAAVLQLSETEQRRLCIEIIPLIWPKACVDDTCVSKFRDLVDEATIKEYREQHMGSV